MQTTGRWIPWAAAALLGIALLRDRPTASPAAPAPSRPSASSPATGVASLPAGGPAVRVAAMDEDLLAAREEVRRLVAACEAARTHALGLEAAARGRSAERDALADALRLAGEAASRAPTPARGTHAAADAAAAPPTDPDAPETLAALGVRRVLDPAAWAERADAAAPVPSAALVAWVAGQAAMLDDASRDELATRLAAAVVAPPRGVGAGWAAALLARFGWPREGHAAALDALGARVAAVGVPDAERAAVALALARAPQLPRDPAWREAALALRRSDDPALAAAGKALGARLAGP